jgi:hypothetical protein
MSCPRTGLSYETRNLVETYQTCSTKCQHCNLLLRATDAYKPGWIEQKTGDGVKREIVLNYFPSKGPDVVSLFETTAGNAQVEVGSFRLLRKPKGMPFYNIIIMLRITSYSLPSR